MIGGERGAQGLDAGQMIVGGHPICAEFLGEVDQVQRRGKQIDPGQTVDRGHVALDAVFQIERPGAVEHVGEQGCDGVASPVAHGPPLLADHHRRQIGLGVEVDQEHPLAVDPGEESRQTGRERGLPDPALEADGRDHRRHGSPVCSVGLRRGQTTEPTPTPPLIAARSRRPGTARKSPILQSSFCRYAGNLPECPCRPSANKDE